MNVNENVMIAGEGGKIELSSNFVWFHPGARQQKGKFANVLKDIDIPRCSTSISKPKEEG